METTRREGRASFRFGLRLCVLVLVLVGCGGPRMPSADGRRDVVVVQGECLELVVRSVDDEVVSASFPVLELAGENRCLDPVAVDLREVHLVGSFEASLSVLALFDPRGEVRAARLGGTRRFRERLAFVSSHRPSEVCIDLAGVAPGLPGGLRCLALPPAPGARTSVGGELPRPWSKVDDDDRGHELDGWSEAVDVDPSNDAVDQSEPRDARRSQRARVAVEQRRLERLAFGGGS